jgi:hypothetical protein
LDHQTTYVANSVVVVVQIIMTLRVSAKYLLMALISKFDNQLNGPSKQWFSHKFHSAGLQYEVGV